MAAFRFSCLSKADTDVAARNSSYGSQAIDKSMHGLEHHNYKLSIYSNCILCSNTEQLFVVLFVFLKVIVLHFINIYSVRACVEYSWLALLGTNKSIGSVPSQTLFFIIFLNKELIPPLPFDRILGWSANTKKVQIYCLYWKILLSSIKHNFFI